jgi:putative nucleotide binding protein
MVISMPDTKEPAQESPRPSSQIKKDEWGIVLDFLQYGHQGMERSQPMAQVIGEEYFSLLEVIIREDAATKLEERLYIGDGKRDKVKYIRGRIEPSDLTSAAKSELADVIDKIVRGRPARFVDFFNKSGPLSTRMHSMELLPGVGKKHLWAIIEARKDKPFESFEDIKKRVPLLPDPEKLIVRRVLSELEGGDRYKIFVLDIDAHKPEGHEHGHGFGRHMHERF